MKLSIFSLPVHGMTFMQAVDFAKENNIGAIEPYPAAEFAKPGKEAVQSAIKLAEYAKEQGIAISCFSMGINVTVGPERKNNIEKLKRYAEITAAMGAPYLHHTLMPSLNAVEAEPMPFKELLSSATDAIREVFDFAKTVGVRTVYENQGFYFNGCERFERLLDSVERNVGVVADVGNINFVGEKPEDFIGRFARHIVHVHIKDYIKKDKAAPYPGSGWYNTRSGDYLRGITMGHGIVDFVTCFRLLISAEYDGWFSMEYDGKEGAEAVKESARNIERYYSDAQNKLQLKNKIVTPHTV